MKLVKYEFTMEQMEPLLKEEKVFFVQLTHFLQEIMILQKCVVYAGCEIAAKTGIEQTAQRVQSLFFIRELAGKLLGGWRMLNISYFGQKLSQRYDSLLSRDGRKKLGNLKKYFNGDNLVYTIRNKYTFHYEREKIEKQIETFSQDEVLCLILAEHYANNLYVFSDDIVNSSILDEINSENHQDATDTLIKEIVLNVCNEFQSFGYDLIRLIIEKLGLNSEEGEQIEIAEVPSLDNTKLPYFVRR